MAESDGAISSGRFRTLYRNTAVRLSALYLILFAVCAAALVFYVTSISETQLQERMKASVDEEVQVLDDIFSRGGIQALLAVLENLSNQPGANLYVIAGPNGELLAGNVAKLQPGVIDREGWTDAPFLYSRFGDRAGGEKHMAVARIFFLENGARILVGRDLGEPENARLLVRQALMLALGIMGLGALIIWFAIGRTALQRIDRMSGAARNIMAGDLAQRLPVSGAGDEFDRLSVSLNAMLARMERLDEGLRQVSDNIAHDLKTPLTRLRNRAESALASDNASSHAAALEDIIAESDQLIRTFNALLMISRVEAGSAVAEMSDIDLGAVAGEVAELYEPLAEDEGLAIARDLMDGYVVRGNRELIGQAISNLIDNAIKYGSAGEPAAIAVSVRRAEGAFMLDVADHGAGIPEEKYREVTKRFVRLDESRSKPGTGLGLALVVAVMELHGGRIEFFPTDPGRETNRGLTVRMVFPEPRSV
jgi:signal transduction histidine kinase